MITKERLDELLAYDPETGRFTWNGSRGSKAAGAYAGAPDPVGRVVIRVDRRLYLAHRLAFLAMVGAFPPDEVDHINGDPADNRWSNLRPATRGENGRNLRRKISNTSGVPGVYWDTSRGKWHAYIQVRGRSLALGRYVKFEDAVAARRAAEVKYFGEFSATTSRKVLDADPAAC